MLTARGRPEDVLKGFAAGADDYLPKPTELAILLARVGGLLRRSQWLRRRRGSATRFAGKTIDFDTLELRVGDRTLPLTLMEANLLRYLIAHEGKAVSRKAMLEDVWGVHEDTDTRAIDNFIVRLRRYIEKDSGKPRHLLTVRGVGYRFVAEPDTDDPDALRVRFGRGQPLVLLRRARTAAPPAASAPADAERHRLRRLLVQPAPGRPAPGACASGRRRPGGRRGSRAR